MRIHRFVVCTVLAFGIVGGRTSLAQKIYWLDADRSVARRANLDGSFPETVFHHLVAYRACAVDGPGAKVYWIDADRIRRANFDGSGIEDLPIVPTVNVGLAIDDVERKIYWISENSVVQPTGSILRAGLDNTGFPELVVTATPLHRISSLQVDPVGRKVYWAEYNDSDPPQGIRRANLDGSNNVEIVPPYGGVRFFRSLALDVVHERVYWSDFDGIYRAHLDGTDSQFIVDQLSYVPRPLSVDPERGKLYWISYGSELYQAGLDGSGAEPLLGADLSDFVADPTTGDLFATVGRGVTRIDHARGTQSVVVQGAGHPLRAIALDYMRDHVAFVAWTERPDPNAKSCSTEYQVELGQYAITDRTVSRRSGYVANGSAHLADIETDPFENVAFYTGQATRRCVKPCWEKVSAFEFDLGGPFDLLMSQSTTCSASRDVAVDRVSAKIYWETGRGLERANYAVIYQLRTGRVLSNQNRPGFVPFVYLMLMVPFKPRRSAPRFFGRVPWSPYSAVGSFCR